MIAALYRLVSDCSFFDPFLDQFPIVLSLIVLRSVSDRPFLIVLRSVSDRPFLIILRSVSDRFYVHVT